MLLLFHQKKELLNGQTVLNINYGHNEKLLSACKPLREYAIFISTIKEYKQKFNDKNMAIEKAIDDCINQNILRDFLLERKAEAMHTLLTEYDEEAVMEGFRQRAYEEGEAAGLEKHLISQICKKMSKGKPAKQIADELEEDVLTIQKIYDVAIDFGPDYDIEKIMDKLN